MNACEECSAIIPRKPGQTGCVARYCSKACRTIAYKARGRTPIMRPIKQELPAGYTACPTCLVPFRGDGDECPMCERERARDANMKDTTLVDDFLSFMTPEQRAAWKLARRHHRVRPLIIEEDWAS